MQASRNEPCPCGSGKKYKKCCLAKHESLAGGDASPARRWHDLDHRMVGEIGRWGAKRFGDAHRHAPEDYPVELDDESSESAAHLPLFATWLAYERKIDGRTLAAWYLAERAKYLTAEERRWLEAQGRAWLSVWEVTSVERGERIGVTDLLTGEKRSVIERTASKTLDPNLFVLARVVDVDGMSLFCGMHANSLYPADGREVLEQAREELGLGKTNVPEKMREDDLATDLIDIWDVTVNQARNRPPPKLANTDGEDLVLIEERFEIEGGAAGLAETTRVLEGEMDVEAAGPGRYSLVRSGANPRSPGMKNTLIASLRLGSGELVVDTNSRERATRVRDRLLSLAGNLLRPGRRTERSPEELLAQPRQASEGRMAGPETDAILREFKAQHYASWADESLPALDGLTAREAAAQPKYRDRLVTLLKEMEAMENQGPAATRFDFGKIRRELGLL